MCVCVCVASCVCVRRDLLMMVHGAGYNYPRHRVVVGVCFCAIAITMRNEITSPRDILKPLMPPFANETSSRPWTNRTQKWPPESTSFPPRPVPPTTPSTRLVSMHTNARARVLRRKTRRYKRTLHRAGLPPLLLAHGGDKPT